MHWQRSTGSVDKTLFPAEFIAYVPGIVLLLDGLNVFWVCGIGDVPLSRWTLEAACLRR
jgi:hypothetical protein